mgnify:CR=1 FL=1
MPTIVDHDIGGGLNHYSDPALWEAATDDTSLTATDEVRVGHLYGHHTTVVTMDGAATDATRYRVLRAAAGQGIKASDPWRFDSSLGAAISSTAGYTVAALWINEDHSRVEGLQVQVSGTNTNQPYRTDNGNLAYRCLFSGGSTTRSVAASATAAGAKIHSCVIIHRGAGASSAAVTLYIGGELRNNIIVAPADLADPADGIFIQYPDGTAVITNNVVCGFASLGSIGTPATCSNNLTDAGSPPSGFSAVAYNTTASAGNTGFENVSDGTHDFRTKAGSALVGAGTATGAPALDLAGTAYASPPPVGAHEIASSSDPTIVSASTTTPSPDQRVTITVTNAGATQGGSTLTLDGDALQIISWSATSITFVFDRADHPNGVPLDLVLTVGGIDSDPFELTPAPPAGWTYVTVASIAGTGGLPASSPIEVDDQIEAEVVTLYDDTTYSAGGSVPHFRFRVWDHDGGGWGDIGQRILLTTTLGQFNQQMRAVGWF